MRLCLVQFCMQGNIDSIINVGTAGGLTQDEQVLDIVISDKVVQADYDTSPLDGPSGVGLVYNSHEKLSQSCIEAAKAMQIRYHVGTVAFFLKTYLCLEMRILKN